MYALAAHADAMRSHAPFPLFSSTLKTYPRTIILTEPGLQSSGPLLLMLRPWDCIGETNLGMTQDDTGCLGMTGDDWDDWG